MYQQHTPILKGEFGLLAPLSLKAFLLNLLLNFPLKKIAADTQGKQAFMHPYNTQKM